MKRYLWLGLVFCPLVAAPFAVILYGQSESRIRSRGESLTFEDLQKRTFQMIDRDPSNLDIAFKNSSTFFSRPAYHAEVLRRMEERVKAKPSHGAYWVLALICEDRARGAHFRSEDEKRRFLQYYGLDSDAGLPKQNDQVLIAKTIQYYKKAIDLARHQWWPLDPFSVNFYSRQLVDFYSRLNRHAEALELCQEMAKQKQNLSDASFLLAYGESLQAAGKADEAEKWLLKVRDNDHEGRQNGPACQTVDAETLLGSIALARGDVDGAMKHLQASTNVQPCCHNVTKGFPTSLASKLLDKGKPAAVAQFCETVLHNFTPRADYMEALLAQARARTAGK